MLALHMMRIDKVNNFQNFENVVNNIVKKVEIKLWQKKRNWKCRGVALKENNKYLGNRRTIINVIIPFPFPFPWLSSIFQSPWQFERKVAKNGSSAGTLCMVPNVLDAKKLQIKEQIYKVCKVVQFLASFLFW